MKEPLISIIIPLYNAEKYIDQCIESIVTQSFSDLEVIIVNDGSTDKSLEKCLVWNDFRIQVISIENHGVSHARNVGLKKASGKWVMFLDSDDYLLPQALESIAVYTSTEVDEISALYMDTTEQMKVSNSMVVSAENMMKMSLDPMNYQLFPAFYVLKDATLLSCCGKLFLNEVIQKNHLCFREDMRLSEDLVFHLEYLSNIQNVLITNVPVFFYRINETSVTRGFQVSHLEDRIVLADALKKYEQFGANVQIMNTWLLFICRVEKYTSGVMRKQLENRMADFFDRNEWVLSGLRNKYLSRGKWQKHFYKIAVFFLALKWNWLAFKILKIYTFVSRGEV